MPEIQNLSDRDIRALRKLIKLTEQGRFNSIPNLDQSLFDEIHQAPETYIALVPSGGIPAATPTGTGATLDFAQGDIPGKATCDVYNLVGGILESADFQKEVYNLSSSALAQQWIPVTRSKWGQWLALSSSVGSFGFIRFVVDSVSSSIGQGAIGCDYVNAEITNVSCDYGGASEGDIVRVYDPDYCTFNIPASLLVGLNGTAKRMNNYVTSQTGTGTEADCISELIAEGDCIWEVERLCCAEEAVFSA